MKMLLALVYATLAVAFLFGPATAHGQDAGVARAATRSDNGDVITLYDGACRFAPPRVKGLPYRATWKSAERTYEGCFAIHQGLVIGYWDDGSISLVSGHVFKPVEEI